MKKLKLILSLAVTALFIYYLSFTLDINSVIDVLSKANKLLVLTTFFLYSSVLFLRSQRFRLLLKEKQSLFPIVLQYNLINYILPLKLGELSYVYFVKRHRKVSVKSGLSSLIVARGLDFVVIISALLIGVAVTGNFHNLGSSAPLAFLLLLAILLSLYLAIYNQRIFHIIAGLLPSRIGDIITNMLDAFKDYKKDVPKTLLYSLTIYVIGFISTFILFTAFGEKMSLAVLLVLVPFGILSGIIPFNGVAGLGTYESFWILGLVFFKYPVAQAVVLAFSLHIIQFLFVIILGTCGWLYHTITSKRQE